MAGNIPDKTRYSYIYHPSRPHKERWEKAAAKAHSPLSKFVVEIVDSYLDAEFQPRELAREAEALRKENRALRDELRQKSILVERYEADLRRYRSAPWNQDSFTGYRMLNDDLISLLRTRGWVDGPTILNELGVTRDESELAKAVERQLEGLQDFGVIKREGAGWRWSA
ncbi:MAG: hypothetical protein A4E45_01752 [Methanosaeta sp. PtaB.Bin039]|nr:MAG: hypothetical protein A4E45_01752 [Methanosaeta sp. PtaB.Bin039]